MAMSAALTQVTTNIIANSPATFLCTISNTGGSDVTLTTFQPVITPSTIPCVLTSNPIAAQGNVTVAATTGTLAVPFQVVFLGPSLGGIGVGNYACSVTANVYTSDGSMFAAPPLTVAPDASADTVDTAANGALRFNAGFNSYAVAFLI